MTAEKMWKLCMGENSGKSYEVWSYGEAKDRLAELTVKGIKTATASAYPCYEAESSPLPKEGDYSVVLDNQENAVCIIKTTRITLVPFHEVAKEHAYKEGEGDRGLEYWKMVHEAFFKREMEAVGLEFTPDMLVVCEEFELIYPKEN